MPKVGTQGGDAPIPYWILASYEEKEVLKRCQDQMEAMCAPKFVAFGDCLKDHQALFWWSCADLKKQLEECVAFWGNYAKCDEVRADYISEKKKRLQEEKKL